eukprot:Platyproteum_vivax@DN7591_c3_g5_i1.p1
MKHLKKTHQDQIVVPQEAQNAMKAWVPANPPKSEDPDGALPNPFERGAFNAPPPPQLQALGSVHADASKIAWTSAKQHGNPKDDDAETVGYGVSQEEMQESVLETNGSVHFAFTLNLSTSTAKVLTIICKKCIPLVNGSRRVRRDTNATSAIIFRKGVMILKNIRKMYIVQTKLKGNTCFGRR